MCPLDFNQTLRLDIIWTDALVHQNNMVWGNSSRDRTPIIQNHANAGVECRRSSCPGCSRHELGGGDATGRCIARQPCVWILLSFCMHLNAPVGLG
jgi:hypothetical protein